MQRQSRLHIMTGDDLALARSDGVGFPPGAIVDWLTIDNASIVQRKLRVLGHSGVVTLLGVVAQQGPVTLSQVIEVTQLEPTLALTRLRELTQIGVLDYHPRSGPRRAMWAIDHDGMTRIGAYFIRPAPRQLDQFSAVRTPDSDQPQRVEHLSRAPTSEQRQDPALP